VIAALRWALAVLCVVALTACSGPRPGPPKNLPPPVESTQVGPGDLLEVSVVGEKDLPREFRVQPDGTIDFPYIDRVKIEGLEPQQIVDLIRQKLTAQQILMNPQVSLIVKQYASKKVSVIGQVQKPQQYPWTDGMKLVDAVSQAGGFTAIADSNHVVLTRTARDGKTVTAIVSVDAITDGTQSDIPLQAGDTIKVEARVF